MPSSADLTVRHFRQILLWPLRLMPVGHRGAAGKTLPHRTPWQILRELGDSSPWREVVDEYTGDPARFHERHYNEFAGVDLAPHPRMKQGATT